MSIIQRQLLAREPMGRPRASVRPATGRRHDEPAAPAAPLDPSPRKSGPVESGSLVPMRDAPTRFNNVAAIYAAMQQQGDAAHFREARFASRLDLSA